MCTPTTYLRATVQALPADDREALLQFCLGRFKRATAPEPKEFWSALFSICLTYDDYVFYNKKLRETVPDGLAINHPTCHTLAMEAYLAERSA